MRFRGLLLSLSLLLLGIGPADAAEPGLGTKNFTPPSSVPNYFSGEAGAIQGTRRAAPMPGTTYAVPVAPQRSRVAMAAPRQLSTKLVRGRDGRYRFVAHGRVVHGHYVARGRGGHRAAHVAVRRVSAHHPSSRRGGRR
jgi:hypothetical protein